MTAIERVSGCILFLIRPRRGHAEEASDTATPWEASLRSWKFHRIAQEADSGCLSSKGDLRWLDPIVNCLRSASQPIVAF